MKLGNRVCHPSLPSPISTCISIPPQQLKMGEKWSELQGSKNWQGLLDPLDNNLREEILRYGKFVEATYNSFDFDPSSPRYASCRFSKHSLLKKCGLPHTGYLVTRNLHATSGIRLPRWSPKFPRWVSNQSSWIGYVAVCKDEAEIARLGRRDVVVAFRGTGTCLEWLENLRTTLTPPVPSAVSGAMVESGFLSLYISQSERQLYASLQQEIGEEIRRILHSYGDEQLSLTFTGHSLGAALATLAAYDITTTFNQTPPLTVISFGGPRVGNKIFRSQVDERGTKVLRIVNSTDLITKVPGFSIDRIDAEVCMEEQEDIHVAGIPLRRWLQRRAENNQWLYSEVGHEFQVSTLDSPVLSGPSNPATCHELDTYLHLVNGFVSSRCPFKATARRLLGGAGKTKRIH